MDMKKLLLYCCTFITFLFLNHAHAQDADPMKAWMDYMTPGDMHKWMSKHVGTWESEVTQWMDPTADPVKVKATDVITMSMDGRYQVGNYSSNIMGMPMMGQSTLAYDNAKKMFVSTWIDNLGTGIVMMSGNYDPATKTLTLKGTQTDPMSGQDSQIKQVNVFHDDDTYTFSMYGAGPDGSEMKFMEGTFKRKK